MSYIPTVEQAKEILMQFNKEPFHISHGEIVSGVLGEIAKKHDPENVEYWKVVGMLHDIDYELYPDQHCIKSQEMMRELDIDEGIKEHAIYEHPKFGKIYAYEVNGKGDIILMDDANSPSLLSAPYLGYVKKDDEIYQNASNYGRLNALSQEKEAKEALLMEKMERWEYLTEKHEQIQQQKK